MKIQATLEYNLKEVDDKTALIKAIKEHLRTELIVYMGGIATPHKIKLLKDK